MPDDLRIIRGLLAHNYPGTSVDRERQAAAFRAGMEKAAHVVSGIVDGSTYEDAEAKIVFAIRHSGWTIRGRSWTRGGREEGDTVSWTYRVIRKVLEDGVEQFGIHEVYYNDRGIAESCTEEPARPTSESLAGLRQVAIMWISALRDGAFMEYSWFEKMAENAEKEKARE